MKKIVFYTDTPQIGGAEKIIQLINKFINREQFETILVCSNYPELNKWCNKIEKEGTKIYRLNVKGKHDPRHFTQLKTILKNEKTDILHIHVWNPASCRYAYFAGHSLKIPIITTEHDPFKLSYFKNLFKKLIIKKVDKIIVVSEKNKNLLENLYPEQKEKIQLIHNGIDLDFWKSQLLRFTIEDRKEIKEKLFLAKEDTLIVLSVAELHERKGQDILINTIPRITEKFPNVKFVFVSKGPRKDDYIDLVKYFKVEKHAIFIGQQNKIPQIMACSDIFVLPSRREAFGLVNIEAMATMLPVIASKVGGVPEIIDDQKSGFLVESENVNEFENALFKLIENETLRKEMGTNGYKIVKSKFTAKIMTENYENIYKNTN